MTITVPDLVTDAHPDLAALPQRLSPSRAKDFLDCPRSFYERTILRIPSEQTLATVRGNLAHAVFERVFDIPEGRRRPEDVIATIPAVWQHMLDDDRGHEYAAVAPAGSLELAELFAFTARMVTNWFAMEHVNAFTPIGIPTPDGNTVDGRELHVDVPLLPGGAALHGYIDRLDAWTTPSGETRWAISDFKTGAVPGAGKSYPQQVHNRILDEAFFAMKAYALLVHDQYGITVDRLRLLYVATGSRQDGIKTLPVTTALLEQTRDRLCRLWDDVVAAASTGTWKCSNSRLCHYRPHQT